MKYSRSFSEQCYYKIFPFSVASTCQKKLGRIKFRRDFWHCYLEQRNKLANPPYLKRWRLVHLPTVLSA